MKEFGIYVGQIDLIFIPTEITNENVAGLTFPASRFKLKTNAYVNEYLNDRFWFTISGKDTMIVELNKVPEVFKNYAYLGQLDKIDSIIKYDMIDHVRTQRYFK